jgi:hypothetical protein
MSKPKKIKAPKHLRVGEMFSIPYEDRGKLYVVPKSSYGTGFVQLEVVKGKAVKDPEIFCQAAWFDSHAKEVKRRQKPAQEQ